LPLSLLRLLDSGAILPLRGERDQSLDFLPSLVRQQARRAQREVVRAGR
jgi:hypothetical protein